MRFSFLAHSHISRCYRLGMVATAARTLLECLDRLPNEDNRTKICIVGVDTALHFFSLAVRVICLKGCRR